MRIEKDGTLAFDIKAQGNVSGVKQRGGDTSGTDTTLTTAPGFGLFHSELDNAIMNASSIDELYRNVYQLRDRWQITEHLLPNRN